MTAQSAGAAGEIGSHWFAIDRSVLAQAGATLFGPPADEVFAAIPPDALRPVLAESIQWYIAHAADPSDAVLNACRALRYSEAGAGRRSPRRACGPPSGGWLRRPRRDGGRRANSRCEHRPRRGRPVPRDGRGANARPRRRRGRARRGRLLSFGRTSLAVDVDRASGSAPELFISATVVAPSSSTSRIRSTCSSGSEEMIIASRSSSSETCSLAVLVHRLRVVPVLVVELLRLGALPDPRALERRLVVRRPRRRRPGGRSRPARGRRPRRRRGRRR